MRNRDSMVLVLSEHWALTLTMLSVPVPVRLLVVGNPVSNERLARQNELTCSSLSGSVTRQSVHSRHVDNPGEMAKERKVQVQ